jgi:transposase
MYRMKQRRMHGGVTRERRRLKKEAAQHQTRIRALLATIGVREERVMVPSLRADGQPLPPLLRAELDREMERLKLVREHLRAVEGHIKAYVETSPDATAEKCRMLSGLKGIGVRSAAALCLEFFGWRQLRNRRQVGGLAGLTGTPPTKAVTSIASRASARQGTHRSEL